VLWQTPSLGLYSNASFDELYRGIGHNNGNLAFVHAIVSHVRNPTVFLPWHSKAEALRAAADLIVIPCANQLGPHTDLGALADTLMRAELPVVAIGLGAQAKTYGAEVDVSPGTRRWVEAIASLAPSAAPNILTRGAYTRDQMLRLGLGNAQVGGCPSHFINPVRDLGARIAANWAALPLPRSIAVAAGHQAWSYMRPIEHQLIGLMMDPLHPGQYVVQSMADMVRISRNELPAIAEDTLSRIREYTVPHYSREEFVIWCRRYARSFYDVPAWMDALRQHDLAVGARYHGVALALQAERMGLTIAIDSRTRELCENTGVPWIAHQDLDGPITRQALKRTIRFDARHYDEHRRRMAGAYVAFLEANRIIPAHFLRDLAR
jgi:hypothetical protein